jgi:hypothetical protein
MCFTLTVQKIFSITSRHLGGLFLLYPISKETHHNSYIFLLLPAQLQNHLYILVPVMGSLNNV